MFIDQTAISNVFPIKKKQRQKIIVINNFIKKEAEDKIYRSLKKSLSMPTKVFRNNGYVVKSEYNDIHKMGSDFKKLYYELYSKRFIQKLRKIFNTKQLYPDGNKLYSGINISKNKSILREHVDFNFNSKLKKFRLINLLLYFNKNYKPEHGGKFYYRDFFSKKKKYINPSFNKAVIFMTNKYVPHGFTTVKKKRISLNLYYYTKQNLSSSKRKHRTLWV